MNESTQKPLNTRIQVERAGCEVTGDYSYLLIDSTLWKSHLKKYHLDGIHKITYLSPRESWQFFDNYDFYI